MNKLVIDIKHSNTPLDKIPNGVYDAIFHGYSLTFNNNSNSYKCTSTLGVNYRNKVIIEVKDGVISLVKHTN